MKTKFFVAAGLLTVLLAACKKVSFNQEEYDKLVEDAFTITVDPSHQWATVKTDVANISVKESVGGTYVINVYLSFPNVGSTCVSVLEATVENGGYVTCPFTHPTSASKFYVSVLDETGRRQVKEVTLSNGLLTCNFTDSDWIAPEGTVNTQPLSFRYLFEENFPDVGDYDFNDVVLSLTPSINDKTLTLKVRLEAVGATKSIGAAIRLFGVQSTDLESYAVTQAFDSPEGKGMGTYTNIDTDKQILVENEAPNNTTNMVIVLFKDAHWAINPEKSSTGGVMNVFYNTVAPSQQGSFSYLNVPAKEAVYTLTFKDAAKAQSMIRQSLYDVFIVEPFNGAYWETHIVENGFKTIQVVTPYKPNGYEEAYGNNMPWAIMVPGTCPYPIEGQIIGTRNGSSLGGAFQTSGHSFAEWAENCNSCTDWYNYPTASLVFE